MNQYLVTNETKGVLVLADYNNANHINLLAKESHLFKSDTEFNFYKKNMDSRIRNGLLKKELVDGSIKQEIKKLVVETMSVPTEIIPMGDTHTYIESPIENSDIIDNEVLSDEKPEFDDMDLAGIDDAPEPVIENKKKKKHKKH